MTARSRFRPGALTARFVGGQMRADAAALAVALGIVALATLLTASIPPAVNGVVSAQVQQNITAAGADAQVVISVPLSNNGANFELAPDTADSAEYVRGKLDEGMPSALAEALAPPVTTMVSRELEAGTIAGQPARVRFAYVASDSGPAVEWVDGRAPAATGTPSDLLESNGEVLPVEVGLSEQVATLMGLDAGDKIPVISPMESLLDVTVSGVYRAEDPSDPAWATVPTLLTPQEGVGAEALTSVGLYSSAESLPFALLATFPDGMARVYTYPVNAEAITADNVREVQAEARGLASGNQAFEITGATAAVQTRLDTEIERALVATNAATAQAAVLLVAMVAIAIAVEVVAAGMLVTRRRPVLGRARSRGATAGVIARALAVESALVVIIGGALGLALAHVLVDGAVEWQWVVPPLLIALATAPVLGARAVTRKAGPAPASGLRRIALEVALLLLAAGAMASLVTRGVSASEGNLWADLLVLAAPVLCALAVGALLLRVLPPITRWLRAAAARAKGVSPLLATARSRTSASAVCALVIAASVIAMAATTGATVQRGLGAAADDRVGSDVVARATIYQVLPDAVEDIDGVGGVTAALAYVVEGAQLVGLRLDKNVTLVAVDAEQFNAMAKSTGTLPDVGSIGAEPDANDYVLPMLVSAGDSDLRGASLHWPDGSVPVRRVGPGVAIPGIPDDEIVVVVDRAALARAIDGPVPATHLWADGAGAEQAVRTAIGDAPATITTRSEWLEDQVSSPVARGMRALFIVTLSIGAVLALLAAALIAASGTAERRKATGRLRVLGLPRARAWRIAQVELTIPVLIATAVGVITGAVLAAVVRAPLHLSSITGERGVPVTVVPWWIFAIPVLLGGVTWLVVAFAARADRSTNVGQLLRAN